MDGRVAAGMAQVEPRKPAMTADLISANQRVCDATTSARGDETLLARAGLFSLAIPGDLTTSAFHHHGHTAILAGFVADAMRFSRQSSLAALAELGSTTR